MRTKKKILFVLDGIRPQLYNLNLSNQISDSFWFKIRKYFINEANKKGFEVIDMQKEFIKAYKLERKKFEFKTDSHWNSVGHKTVANSIENSIVWKSFIQNK